MGKIKEKHLKMVAKKLLKSNPELFSENFEQDKAKINELAFVNGGKHDRNRLAGQIARTKKRELKILQRKAQSMPQPQPFAAARPAA